MIKGNAAQGGPGDVRRFVVSLWCAELGVPDVGDTDDFFALGGHSLAALNVLTDVEDAFQVELDLRTVFEHPTLSDFVSMLASLAGVTPAEPESARAVATVSGSAA
ncbi:phosphopantetheine-binding protein [Streptomyces sp. NBC_01317]|uniref:phosphopantetheine-binding protein n=1 Tax=Streptomyces sp. NBC_01317 TaxID=2903822 RepID=UPI002E0EF106|nr:phosphopantetheine-binding protein [Streptomyces sp. NBC_01317]